MVDRVLNTPLIFIPLNRLFHFRTKIFYNCDALRNLVPFVQFKKRKKHPRKSVTFSKVAA